MVVLEATSLAFPVLLGFDFAYFTGMVWDIVGSVFWFRDDETRKYPFSLETSPLMVGEVITSPAFFSAEASPTTTFLGSTG